MLDETAEHGGGGFLVAVFCHLGEFLVVDLASSQLNGGEGFGGDGRCVLAYFEISVFKALHGDNDELGFTGGEGCFGGVVGFCHLGCDRMPDRIVTLVGCVEDMIEVAAECELLGEWKSRRLDLVPLWVGGLR